MTNQERIDIITSYQANHCVHPLTCGNDSMHENLIPAIHHGTVTLVCVDCNYEQAMPDSFLEDLAKFDKAAREAMRTYENILRQYKAVKPELIYVAGPISAPDFLQVMANAEKAIDAGIQLIQKGHFPFVPHLSVWTNVRAENYFGAEIDWETWMKIDDAFLCKCDALLYLGSSRGADIELARAKELGLRIFYSVDEVEAVSE